MPTSSGSPATRSAARSALNVAISIAAETAEVLGESHATTLEAQRVVVRGTASAENEEAA
jgi:hypothetical protein